MHGHKLLSTIMIGGTLLFTGTGIQAETLQEAINGMLQSNPEVRSVAYNRLGRDQEVRQAKSGYFPTLEASAGIGYQDVQEPLDDTLYPQQYTLSLRQNVFAGLSTLNEVDRQKSRVRSAAYRLQGTSENSALRTSEVYLNVLRRQELLRLSEENLDTHLRIADQIKMRSDSGVASKADSDQVAGRVSLAQSNVIATRTNLIDAHSNYLSVVGHLPTDLQKPAPVDKFFPASLKDAEEAAVKQHPTLKSANADLVARQQQYDVAKAPYFPVVDIEVDQNWTEDLDTDGKDASLIAMVRLRYNLFHGFRDEARRAETAHLISEAREIRNNTNRQVVESMRLSWMAFQAAQERIKFLEQRVASTTETAASYTKQFNLGKRTLLDVLDTEAEVIDAKQSLVEASYTGLYAGYRVLNGLGMLVKSFDLQWPKESQVEDEEKDQDREQKDSKVNISSEIRTFENRDGYLSAS
jgi:outer membrane protein, adhesin transport system